MSDVTNVLLSVSHVTGGGGGGGGGGGYVASDWADPTKPAGAIVSDVVSPVPVLRRTGITSITLNEATTLPNSFAYLDTGLTAFSAPKVETIGTYCLSGCTALTSVNLPLLTVIETYTFSGCTSLGACKFPNVTTVKSHAFDGCSAPTLVFPKAVTFSGKHELENWGGTKLDLHSCNRSEYALSGSNNLTTVILRKTSDVSAMPYGLRTGSASNPITVYVPSALISTYETATNWSTWVASTYASFAAIEGSIYENNYADGSPIS